MDYGICKNGEYSIAVDIIQCFSMQNLELLKFRLLVSPQFQSTHTRIDSDGSDYNFFCPKC